MDEGSRRALVSRITASPNGVSTFVVRGSPGIGKTTVLRQVSDVFVRQGRWVGWTGADELSTRRPFGVVADVLGLELEFPPAPDVFDRIEAVVDQRTTAGPAVIVVDDVHHADSDSLAVVWRLASMATEMPLQLVLSRRRLPAREQLAVLEAQPHVEAVELGPLDPAERDALATDLLGGRPGPRLGSFLPVAGGNPLYLRELVRTLEHDCRLTREGPDEVELSAGATPSVASIRETVGHHVRLLGRDALDLVRQVAVWGTAIAPGALAALRGTPVSALTGPITEAVDAGVVEWDADDHLVFANETYAAATYDDIDPPLRRMLHAASAAILRARGAPAGTITHHLDRAATDATRVPVARELRDVASGMPGAPGVAADVLRSAATLATGDGDLSRDILVDRVRALARSGQMAMAAEVAEGAIRDMGPDVPAAIFATLVMSYSTRAMVGDVDRVVDHAIASGIVPVERHGRLRSTRQWVHLLAGEDLRAPLPPRPPGWDTVTPETGTLPLVIAAARAMHTGDGITAVELAERAALGHRQLIRADEGELASVDIWPALWRLHTFGPDDARRHVDHWRRDTAEQGQAWVEPLHQLNSATIAFYAGDLDDAAAELDAGLDAAAATGAGWGARSVGLRARVDLARGLLDEADRRIDEHRRLRRPDTFGMPVTDFVAAEVARARNDHARAGALASAGWTSAAGRGVTMWMLLSGPDHLRLALDIDDRPLFDRVRDDLSGLDASGASRRSLLPSS